MIMRRFALVTGLAASALAFGGTAAFADSVTLDGTVANYSTITSTRTSGTGMADDLNLYGVGTANADVVVKVADIELTTNNDDQGVELTATAGGALTNGTDSLSYQVKLVDNDATAPAANTFASSTDAVNVDASDFTDNAADQDLYIEYDAPQYLDPGSYTSTVTMTVTSYL